MTTDDASFVGADFTGFPEGYGIHAHADDCDCGDGFVSLTVTLGNPTLGNLTLHLPEDPDLLSAWLNAFYIAVAKASEQAREARRSGHRVVGMQARLGPLTDPT